MWVSVVEIRVVRVGMAKPRMLMGMGVRLAGQLAPGVLVLMMLVVDVHVVVHELPVLVLVFMMLGQMKPDAQGHEGSRHQQRWGEGFPQQHRREHRAEEGREREIRAGACGTNVA